MSRRGLLRTTAVLGAAGAGMVGAIGGLPALSAAAHPDGETVRHYSIGSWPLYYLGSPATSDSNTLFDPFFYSRLDAWRSFYDNHTPPNWVSPGRIDELGVHGHGDTQMHYYARAIDLQNVWMTEYFSGQMFKAFDCVYRNGTGVGWYTYTGSALVNVRKRYWAAVASLSYHCSYVIHYLYNAAHENHVHVDNEASGALNSTFNTGARTQVYTVQACLIYIWGYPLSDLGPSGIDGYWGSYTDNLSRRALARMGRSGGLTTSQANWLEFCKASLRFGTGTQSY